jgi:hypothetical protein
MGSSGSGRSKQLIATDAACIEEAFRVKLATIATDSADGLEMPHEAKRPQTRGHRLKKRQSAAIDHSGTAWAASGSRP